MDKLSGSRPYMRRTGPGIFGRVILVGVFVLTVPATILGLAFLFGAVDLRGPHLDWGVVSALAGAASAAATLVAALTIVWAGQELRLQEEADRVARQPYLRVDVDLVEGGYPVPSSFDAPKTGRVFNAWDFGRDDLSHALEGLHDAEGSREVRLFVRNLQNAPLGIAYDVVVELLLEWTLGEHDGGQCRIQLNFAYVAPGQTTAFEICRLRQGLTSLRVIVEDVRYQGLFSKPEQLREVHGALELVWSQQDIRHERRYRLSR